MVGFIYPQVGQMQFEDVGRTVFRHPSDVYVSIDDEGNFELAHPSGAFVRIGTSAEHEDLTGKDYDGRWKIERNTGQQTHIHIEQGDTSVDISPDGDVVVKAPYVKLDAEKVVLGGRTTIDGSLHVKGKIGATGDVIANDGLVSLAKHKHTTGTPPAPPDGASMPPADD